MGLSSKYFVTPAPTIFVLVPAEHEIDGVHGAGLRRRSDAPRIVLPHRRTEQLTQHAQDLLLGGTGTENGQG
jgi:hypothetical protein